MRWLQRQNAPKKGEKGPDPCQNEVRAVPCRFFLRCASRWDMKMRRPPGDTKLRCRWFNWLCVVGGWRRTLTLPSRMKVNISTGGQRACGTRGQERLRPHGAPRRRATASRREGQHPPGRRARGANPNVIAILSILLGRCSYIGHVIAPASTLLASNHPIGAFCLCVVGSKDRITEQQLIGRRGPESGAAIGPRDRRLRRGIASLWPSSSSSW